MSILDQPPKLINANWQQWSQRLSTWLAQTRSSLRHKLTGESAAEDGVLLWDRENKEPTISLNGEFVPLTIADGYGLFRCNVDQSPAAANTAYAIPYDETAINEDVAVGTPTSRITFTRAGLYYIAFSVQVTSNNSSTKNLWFWPRLNGTDLSGSTIKASISDNNYTMVASRSSLFHAQAGDYLEAMYAADSTSVTLDASAATAFAPAAPCVTVNITRLRQL